MHYRLRTEEQVVSFRVDRGDGGNLKITRDDVAWDVGYRVISGHHIQLVVNGIAVNTFIDRTGGGKTVAIHGVTYCIEDADRIAERAPGAGKAGAAARAITPPMPSVVVRILVAEGDRVNEGDSVVVVMAMKMESTLTAPHDGTVRTVNVAVGDKVMPGQILVDIDKENGTSEGEKKTG